MHGRGVLIGFPVFPECRVTRLIKASKQQKPTREAVISDSGSLTSLVFGEGSSKLNVAQSELQACESHLANKERELEVLRLSTIRVGLHARCTALVNCGWSWAEMGKEGLRALESLDTMTNGHCELYTISDSAPSQFFPLVSPPHSPRFPVASKPLSDTGDAPSDLSSILPSHSASQIGLVLSPGPSDFRPPDTEQPIPGPSRLYSFEIPPAHSISDHAIPTGTEAPPVEADSSSEDHGPLEAVENDQLVNLREPRRRTTKSKRRPEVNTIKMAEKSALPNGSPVTKYKGERDGSRKHGVLGTIAGLFTKSSPKKNRSSKMNRNPKGESSDDDDVKYLAVSPSKHEVHSTSVGGEKLKKRRKNRASTLDHHTFETHWPTSAGKGKARAASLDYGHGGRSASQDQLPPQRVITRRRSSSQPHLPLPSEGVSMSRSNSLTKSVASITSAPPLSNPSRAPTPGNRKRSTSGGVHSPTKTGTHSRTVSGSSGPINPVHPQTNLMSIVEEAVRFNRETRISMNPNNRLESIKAPPSVSEVLKREAEVIQANTQPPLIPQALPPKPAGQKSLPRGPEDPVIKQIPPTQHSAGINSPETTSTPTNKPTSPSVDKPFLGKTPLKSALRNPSRTPSPNPLTLRSAVSSPLPPQLIGKISERPEDDDASISSYETGHENFDSRSESPPAPPVPPRDPIVNPGVDSDLSHGTSSTAIASTDTGIPTRRKSVRMSLPPTYSITPPAKDDWEVAKLPWSGPREYVQEEASWTSRSGNVGEQDLWEDSTDEDEEYHTARKLLNKLSGRH